jgi:hypothetical protein
MYTMTRNSSLPFATAVPGVWNALNRLPTCQPQRNASSDAHAGATPTPEVRIVLRLHT